MDDDMMPTCKPLTVRMACMACLGMFFLQGDPACADYPYFPVTVELGPGNEDFSDQITGDHKSLSEFREALSGLAGFDLSHRDLRISRLHLYDHTLSRINFEESDLTGSHLGELFFDDCSFRGAIMCRVNLGRVPQIKPNCDMTGADIAGSTLWLSREQLVSTKSYQSKDLSSVSLAGEFEGVSFAGFNLDGATIDSNLAGCDMTGAVIRNSRLRLSKEQLLSTQTFQSGDLDSVTLVDTELCDFNFSKFTLGLFVSCDLTGANLSGACFMARDDIGDWPSVRSGFMRCKLTAEQFYSTRNYKMRRLPAGFAFEHMDLSGWDFSGMDLRWVTFHVCNMTGANLENARGGIFRSSSGLTVEQVKSMWNFRNGRLEEHHGSRFSLPSDLLESLKTESRRADE